MCEHHALQLGIAMVVYLNELLCSFPQLYTGLINLFPALPTPTPMQAPLQIVKKKLNGI